MEVIEFITSNYQTILLSILAVIGGSSAIIRGMLPWTKSWEADDKALAWLQKVHRFLSKLALHPKPPELPAKEPAPSQEE